MKTTKKIKAAKKVKTLSSKKVETKSETADLSEILTEKVFIGVSRDEYDRDRIENERKELRNLSEILDSMYNQERDDIESFKRFSERKAAELNSK